MRIELYITIRIDEPSTEPEQTPPAPQPLPPESAPDDPSIDEDALRSALDKVIPPDKLNEDVVEDATRAYNYTRHERERQHDARLGMGWPPNDNRGDYS